MAQNTTEPQVSEAEANEKRPNLWTGIFSRTEETLGYVLKYQPEEFIHRHYILVGLMLTLGLRLPDWLATSAHPIGVMIQLLLAGPIMGMVLGYIFSAVVRNVGRWMGWVKKGEAVDSKRMRAIIAWSSLPFTVAYTGFWVSYLAVWLLRPEGMKLFILMDGISGWIPLIVFIPLYAYALYLRWKSIAWFFQAKTGPTVLGWLVSFVLTYGPAFIFAATYIALYTRSVQYLFSR